MSVPKVGDTVLVGVHPDRNCGADHAPALVTGVNMVDDDNDTVNLRVSPNGADSFSLVGVRWYDSREQYDVFVSDHAALLPGKLNPRTNEPWVDHDALAWVTGAYPIGDVASPDVDDDDQADADQADADAGAGLLVDEQAAPKKATRARR